MTTKPIRIRRKTNTTADDPAFVTSQIDPTFLRFTVADAEAGVFSVILTPEDTTIDPLTISFTATDGSENAVAAGLAARANVLAATSPGWGFLRPAASTSSSAELALAIAPTAPPMVASVVDPGSATLTPEHTGIVPIVAKGDGVGSLSLVMTAVSSAGVPLAPGSGNANLQLVELVDRTAPRGPSGPTLTVGPSMVVTRSVVGQPLNQPWVVPTPAGFFTVRIDTDASMPGGIAALEVHASKVETPPVGDESIDSANIAPGAVDPVHLASGGRANTVDTAVVLDAADNGTEVTISSTAGAGTRTITRGTLPVGGFVFVRMTAYATNAYTAAVLGGTVTFDAVAERSMLMWNGTNLVHYALVGATFA